MRQDVFLIFEKAVLKNVKSENQRTNRDPRTSKFLTVSLEARAMSSSAAISLDNVSLRCLGPSIQTSVLSALNKRKLRVIQVFMSLKHA